MNTLDKVRETFRNVPIGSEFTRAEIKHLVFTKYIETPDRIGSIDSIIPSDYCYNMTNKGKVGSLERFNIFIQIKRGLYKYVGENYQY